MVPQKVLWKPLTLSWRGLLSYRNQSIDLPSKSVDWFLYDKGLRHERVKAFINPFEAPQRSVKIKIQVDFFSLSGIGTGSVVF